MSTTSDIVNEISKHRSFESGHAKNVSLRSGTSCRDDFRVLVLQEKTDETQNPKSKERLDVFHD